MLCVIFSTFCSEEQKPALQKALPCTISYNCHCEDKIAEFFEIPVYLTYNDLNERGVVHRGPTERHSNVLQRLIIPKEQFAKIATIINDGESLAQLDSNKLHSLRNCLYISIKQNEDYIIYKINHFRHIKPSEIEEAGYASSDSESDSGKEIIIPLQPVLLDLYSHATGKSIFFGVVIGIAILRAVIGPM